MPGRRSAVRAQLLNPAQLATLPVVPLYVVARQHGWIADRPLWVLLGALVLAQVGSSLASALWPQPRRPAEVWARVSVMQLLLGLSIYVTGWGAALALGFVFGASESIRVVGSRAARPAAAVTVLAILVGEILVAASVLPSMIAEPEGHGLAALEALGAALIIALLGWANHEKEQVEESVRRSEERFRALVQHGSDVIMVIDLDGQVRYLSPSVERALGYDPDAVAHITREFIDTADVDRARAFLRSVAASAPGEVAWIEMRVRHANRSLRWFEVGVTNRLDDPSVGGLVCNMRDITERKGIEAELAHRAHHDSLTSLPNRSSFLNRLESAIESASRHGTTLAVLFLDVDRFKLVNDSLGHDVGDHMLFDVAARLRTCVRPQDTVARFGGDEFTILLDDIGDVNGAVAVAERITEVLRTPLDFRDREIVLSASIGIALSTSGSDTGGDLLRQADLAMYLAKEKGRSRWELFDSYSAPKMVERLELESDLWRAIEQDELRVRFQPEFSLVSGDVASAEALVRWQHPTRGLLEPKDFVPFAEESSLILALDRWVLREACRNARGWSDRRRPQRRLVVSVNLSPRFIRQPDAVGDIMSVMSETGVDPRCLQIEITERTALTDVDRTIDTLQRLRALGIRIAIDDFGTGYSSLGYLKLLPVDVVKLDRSFVESMDVLESDVAIVQAVITMGHALGMKVTAEGVERVEQAARLRVLGCDTAMGWYWTSAVAPEDMATLLLDEDDRGGRVDHVEHVVVPIRPARQHTA